MGGPPGLLTRAPSLAGVLARPRLVDAAGTVPVVVFMGASGSGTTTAAAQLAQADGQRVAWCRLAPGYDRAADVVQMVARTAGVEVEPARRVLELSDQLLELIESGPFTVVVDEYQLAADAELDRLLAECAELLPTGGRIVVASAVRPAGLVGLVGPARLRVLDPVELAFTDEEASALFEQRGASAESAVRWNHHLGGWAQGVVAGASTPDADPARHVASLLDQVATADPLSAAVLDAGAALPYFTTELLGVLGVPGTDEELRSIITGLPLIVDHAGVFRMAPAAADFHRERIDPMALAAMRRRAASELADDDPTTSIELFLECAEPDAAADVLADHLSEIGVERALGWLYRLPAELRRRFPPVLAAGQATVEVDTALAAAGARVEAATTERSRREALFALGSVEAHRGELAAAAGAFEAARRSARGDPAADAAISAELATTRWLLGDIVGARAALDDAGSTTAMAWLRAQLDVVDTDSASSASPPRHSALDPGGTANDGFALAAAALAAWRAGDRERAHAAATAAYASAVESGGDALVAGAAVYGWSLVQRGDTDGALVVAEELERRLGPRHRLAQVHGALIRERCSRGGDAGRHERDQRRLRGLRTLGYASIEQLAIAVLDDDGTTRTTDSVVVSVLGTHRCVVDGRTITRSDWTSKKAFEVLTVLAARGSTGAHREVLIEAVWPGRDPEKGRTLLRTALSEIRRVLEPGRPAGEPSRHVSTVEDTIRLAGSLDLDRCEALIDRDPGAAFDMLARGLAPEVATTEWAQDWQPRVERLLLAAASRISADVNAEAPLRIRALEAMIDAEPWQRRHYDALAELHRDADDDAAAAEVERRWFADD